jgi:hypothetical protein
LLYSRTIFIVSIRWQVGWAGIQSFLSSRPHLAVFSFFAFCCCEESLKSLATIGDLACTRLEYVGDSFARASRSGRGIFLYHYVVQGLLSLLPSFLLFVSVVVTHSLCRYLYFCSPRHLVRSLHFMIPSAALATTTDCSASLWKNSTVSGDKFVMPIPRVFCS